MNAVAISGLIAISFRLGEPAKEAPSAGTPEDPAVAKERKANDEAFENQYLTWKESLFAEHAGEWVAIAT